ncbi:MAG TPA: cysteine desulfurase family protein [Oligoflexia bacterium]|nr:cysteine desulfurase family protein [Oligoflexia bacterium]HMR25634.1 cysteine desulfurase family protein [Oligoflexia bacterium]
MQQVKRIYLDHNASSLIRPSVKQAVLDFLELNAGNPSSIHGLGRQARACMDQARDTIAQYLAVPASSIIFTSGATEANHMAWNAFLKPDINIVSSDTEHPCILGAQARAQQNKAQLTLVHCCKQDDFIHAFQLAIKNQNIDFCSLHLANNETGIILPIKQCVNSLLNEGKNKPYLHIDAVQAIVKVNIDEALAFSDYFTLSGHKLGALAGSGVLIKKDGVPFKPLWEGSAQEKGRRGGTENLLGIVAMAAACQELSRVEAQEKARCLDLRDQLETAFLSSIPNIEIVGQGQERLGNTSCIVFQDIDAQALLVAADLEGIDLSTGSACTSGSVEPSHVLLNMGYSKKEASSALRFSLGWNNTEQEIQQVCKIFPKLVERARSIKS